MDSSQLQIIITAIDEASAQLVKISDSLKAVGTVGDEMNTQLADGAKVSDAAFSELTATTAHLGETMLAVKDEMATMSAVMAEQTAAMDVNTASIEDNTVAHATNNSAMGKAGAAAAILAVGIGYAIDKTVKSYSDYQGAVTRLNTSANESVGNLKMVSDGMLDIARQTGTGAGQLAQAMYYIESAGYHGAQGLAVLTAAAKGAKDENADVKEVADAVSTVMVAYGKAIQSPTAATNAMIAAVSRGKTTLQDFSTSLATVLPVASSAGISFNQVAGAIATMTAQGMTAQNATQNLRNAIQHLQNPTQQQISFLQQMGLNVTALSQALADPKQGLVGAENMVVQAVQAHTKEGQTYIQVMKQSQSATQDAQAAISAMPPALAELSKQYLNGTISYQTWYTATKSLPAYQRALAQQFTTVANKALGFSDQLKTGSPLVKAYTAALATATGSTSGLQTALMLSGQHASTFADNVNAVGKALNSNSKEVSGWNEMQATMGQRLSELKEDFQTLGIQIGQAFAPVITNVAKILSDIVTPITALITHFPVLAVAVLGTVGAFAALVAVGVGIYKIKSWTMEAAQGLGFLNKELELTAISEKAVEAATWLWEAAMGGLNVVTGIFIGLLDSIGIGELLGLIALVLAAILGLIKGIQMLIAHFGGWGKIMHDTVNGIKAVWTPIVGFFSMIWDGITRVFKDGIYFLEEIWNSPMKAASDFVAKFEAVFPRLLGDLGYYGKKIIEEVITWGPKIVIGLITLPALIVGALVKGFEAVYDHLEAIGSTIFLYIKKGFEKVLTDAPQLLNDLVTAVKAGAKDIQNEAEAIGDTLYGKVKSGWEKASSKAKELGKTLLTDIKSGIESSVNSSGAFSATAHGQGGSDIADKIFASLGLSGKGGAEGKALGAANKLLAFDIGSMIDWAKSARGAADKAGAVGTAIWKGIKHGFDSGKKDISSWWDGVQKDFKNGIHMPSFSKMGKDIIHSIISGMKSAVKDVISFFKNLPDLLKGDVHKSGSDTAQHHADGFTSLFGDHSKMLKIGDAILKGIGIAIAAVIGAILLLAISIGIAIINAVVKGIMETISAIATALGKVASLISGAFSGAVNWLYQAGKDLINGLKNGILDAGKDAVGAVKHVGKDVVDGLKGLLGIHSPSTVFAEIGQNIGAGMAKGLEGAGSTVQNAAKNIIPTVALSGTRASVGTAASSSGQAINTVIGTSGVTSVGGTGSQSAVATSAHYTINVNVGMYAGQEGEMDKIATMFWQSFQRIARQHGMAGNMPQIGVRPT